MCQEVTETRAVENISWIVDFIKDLNGNTRGLMQDDE